MTAPQLIVYSRPGCHLCEDLIEELMPLVRGRATLEVRNIDDDPALAAEYGIRIPVVEVNGKALCQHVLDRDAILDALSGAMHR